MTLIPHNQYKWANDIVITHSLPTIIIISLLLFAKLLYFNDMQLITFPAHVKKLLFPLVSTYFDSKN